MIDDPDKLISSVMFDTIDLIGAGNSSPGKVRKPWVAPMVIVGTRDSAEKTYYNREVVNSLNTIGPS